MKFYERFQSRRSVVMGRRGMAASSQPLAVEAAINTLHAGGNAIDAAVAATAVLGVVEPMSTGLGGDCFALIRLAKENRLIALNASGRAPRSASADALLDRGFSHMPVEGPLSVTVPGALEGLARCLASHGTLSLRDTFQQALFYAQHGFPVTEVAAQQWKRSESKLERNLESARVYLPEGRAPLPGELFRNPDLARTLESISESGTSLFYRGNLGERIVESVREVDGAISLEDLAAHTSEWVEPIRTSYRGFDVVEMPPNTQGLAVLVALNVLEGYPLAQMAHNSPEYLHYLVEATKLALWDAHSLIADAIDTALIEQLLSKARAQNLRAKIDAAEPGGTGPLPLQDSSDTVFVAAVDEEGNVVSMISSLFKAFGSGITVPGTGLLLQNRAACFSLEPGHPNQLMPGKRPFHTIIPAMILRGGQPWACFGVVGGLMQAQGHVQVVCNLIDFEMNPQAALDASRFRLLDDGHVALEAGIQKETGLKLSSMGHSLSFDSTEEGFGGGQIILISDGGLYGGSDPRKDGCALGY